MKNYFETIYNLAKAQKEDELVASFEQIISIDEQQKGYVYWTAGAQLALEKNHPACQLLIKLGADKSKIAMGAARAGDKQFVEELIKQGISVNMVVLGAAWGGRRQYAEELRDKYLVDFSWICMGAALGGYELFAEQQRNKEKVDIDLLAMFAAINGENDYRYALKLKEKNASIGLIACGAALRSGDSNFVKDCRQEKINAIDDDIAYGLGFGGHFDNASTLHSKNSELALKVEEGAVVGNHVSYLLNIIDSHSGVNQLTVLKRISGLMRKNGFSLQATKLENHYSYQCPRVQGSQLSANNPTPSDVEIQQSLPILKTKPISQSYKKNMKDSIFSPHFRYDAKKGVLLMREDEPAAKRPKKG